MPARLAMLGHDIGEDAAAYIEFGSQAHEFRVGSRDQVIKDLVCYGFMEAAFVTERPHIELEALQFDTFLVGDVIQVKHREIRLAGLGAKTGELRDLHVDMEITARFWIVEGFKRFSRLTRHKGYRINRNKSDAA